eukprot:107658-Chlamydomonas_euryale.AAC.11
MQVPVHVLNQNTKRDQGRKAQLGNITAAKVRASGRVASLLSGCPPYGLAWPHAVGPRGRTRATATPSLQIAESRNDCMSMYSMMSCAGGRRYHPHDPGAPVDAEDAAGRVRRNVQHDMFVCRAGIVLTNDGNAILREIDVSHPAAKVREDGRKAAESMIQLSRTQDEEVGDGTTSVIILAGELLSVAEPFLQKNLHPTVICKGYAKALEDALAIIEKMSFPIDTNDRAQMLNVVNSCIATKFTQRFGNLMAVSFSAWEDGAYPTCVQHVLVPMPMRIHTCMCASGQGLRAQVTAILNSTAQQSGMQHPRVYGYPIAAEQ